MRLISEVSRTFAMDIRRAEPEDAAVLTDIAFAAKRHWGYPEAWIELWRPGLTITPDFVQTYEVWAAEIAGELVGFAALGEPGERMELEHLWVLPTTMGRGVGRALFEHATARARGLGANVFVIESDPNAESFYLQMGAVRVGERVTEYEGLRRVLPLLQMTFPPI